MSFLVRQAGHDDAGELLELDRLARRGDHDRHALVRAAIADRRCLVVASDRLLGYALTAPAGFFGRDFLELVVVRDSNRRQGVGRALVRAAVEQATTPRVFSSTNESNGAMRSLFASEGWTVSGRLDGLDDGDPEIVHFIDREVDTDPV